MIERDFGLAQDLYQNRAGTRAIRNSSSETVFWIKTGQPPSQEEMELEAEMDLAEQTGESYSESLIFVQSSCEIACSPWHSDAVNRTDLNFKSLKSTTPISREL